MPRHIQQPEYGTEAFGPGPLEWVVLPTGATVTWDFDNRATSNAKLTLNTNTILDIVNVPIGASGNLIVTMGPTGAETLSFTEVVRSFYPGGSVPVQVRDLIPVTSTTGSAGSRVMLTFTRDVSGFFVTSTFLGVYRPGVPGLVPGTPTNGNVNVPSNVLLNTGWGKIVIDTFSENTLEYLLNRANHEGFMSAQYIEDLRETVTDYALHEFAPPQQNINLNEKNINNVRDPILPGDAVNLRTLTQNEQLLLFMQVFS